MLLSIARVAGMIGLLALPCIALAPAVVHAQTTSVKPGAKKAGKQVAKHRRAPATTSRVHAPSETHRVFEQHDARQGY
jgi:hypothetical protein